MIATSEFLSRVNTDGTRVYEASEVITDEEGLHFRPAFKIFVNAQSNNVKLFLGKSDNGFPSQDVKYLEISNELKSTELIALEGHTLYARMIPGTGSGMREVERVWRSIQEAAAGNYDTDVI